MLSSRNSDSEPGRRDHNYMQHHLIHRCLGSHKSLVFFNNTNQTHPFIHCMHLTQCSNARKGPLSLLATGSLGDSKLYVVSCGCPLNVTACLLYSVNVPVYGWGSSTSEGLTLGSVGSVCS